MDQQNAVAEASGAADPNLFYERFADEFDDAMNAYEVGKRLRLIYDDALASTPLEGRKLLDAGCGTGLFSQVAAERGASVTSMDLGPGLLAQVAKKCDSERIVGSVTEIPLNDDSHELVVCTEVIEHTPDPRLAIAELARVLAPGGVLVLTTPNRVWHPMIRLANLLRLRPYEGLENWIRWRDLRHWLEEEGLSVERMLGFNSLPFLHRSLYGLIDRLDARFGSSAPGRWMINMLAVARKPA